MVLGRVAVTSLLSMNLRMVNKGNVERLKGKAMPNARFVTCFTRV